MRKNSTEGKEIGNRGDKNEDINIIEHIFPY